MNFADAMTFVRQRIHQEVEDAYPEGLALQYDNAPDVDQRNRKKWARVSLRNGVSFKVSTGTPNRFRHPGIILWNVFTKLNSGDNEAYKIADFISAVFQNTRVNDVHYKTVSVSFAGVDNGWYQVNVECPYYFDEIS